MDNNCKRCGMAVVYQSGDIPLSLPCGRCGFAAELHINKSQDFLIVHLETGEDILIAEDCVD